MQPLYTYYLRNQPRTAAVNACQTTAGASESISRESEGIRTPGESGQDEDVTDEDTLAEDPVDEDELASGFDTRTMRVGIAGEPDVGGADGSRDHTPLSNGQNDNHRRKSKKQLRQAASERISSWFEDGKLPTVNP
jgi:hypothetical protein